MVTFAQYNARFRIESAALRKELAKRTGVPVGGLANPSSLLLDEEREEDVAHISKVAKHLSDMADDLEN